MPSTKVDLSPQVSSKSLSIQSNTKKQPAKPIEKPSEEEDVDAGGVSKDKMALAMSFFANDKGAKKPAKKPAKSKTENSDDLPNVHNATAKPFNKSTRERAFFEPSTELPDDEEDEIPNFASRRQQRQATEPEAPPPVPSRSGENKHLMLKLMKNATNALRS